MRSGPAVLLLDDGELDLVEELLEELGIEAERLSGKQIRRKIPIPTHLLVTSGRRALAMEEPVAARSKRERPTWITFHNQDFLPFRERMRQIGVNYLVHSAVDRESLRLLLVHALYRGPRTRGRMRLPVGGRAELRIDGRSASAILTEISTRGCRLLSTHDALPGAPVIIGLPPDLGAGRVIKLPGSVVRVEPEEGGPGDHCFCMAVKFEGARQSSIQQVIRILQGKTIGSRVTRLDQEDDASPPEGAPAPARRESMPAQRQQTQGGPREFEQRDARIARSAARGVYVHALPATIDELPRIVVGRDLSPRGMRIDANPELALGTSLRIALYRGGTDPPIYVEAVVVRDDGGAGLVVSFDSATTDVAKQIEALVHNLPPLESLASDRGSSDLIVLSSVTPQSAARPAPHRTTTSRKKTGTPTGQPRKARRAASRSPDRGKRPKRRSD